ncbi:MAG: Calx-beta domain-containing protein, partial [Aureliella sp.]
SFGTSGTTVFTIGDGFEPAQIILQPDGRAVVSGVAVEPGVGNHLALARFLADPRPGNLQFAASSYRVDENAGLATITVQRTGGTDGEVTVKYAVTSGTAQAGSDFVATSGTLTFADGESEKTFTVTLIDNAAAEGDETVQLALSVPGGGAVLGQQTTAVLHIYDGPGKIGFAQPQYYAGEDFGRIDIAMVRNDGSDGTASVTFSIVGVTATPDADYISLQQVVTFGDGETVKNVSVTILNDNIVEGLEAATLILSAPTGGAALDPLHTATLLIFDQETGEAHNPGSPDASWGGDGVVETDFSPAQDGTAFDNGRDIAIQSNGRAVVIGSSDTVDGTRDFAVARYLSGGSLDTSFGGDGRVTTDLGGRDEAEKVLVQSDGKIVVVGYSVRNGASDFAMVRYLANGALDTTFGSGGVVLTDFAKADDRAYSATIDSQGRIVVAGSSGDAFHRDFAVARYLPSGALDTTFSSDGRVTTDFDGRSDIGRDVAIDNSGKIVVVGGTVGYDGSRRTAGDIAMARYLANGTLDTNFDGDGRVRTNVNVLDNDSLNDDEGRRVIVLGDGNLLVGGTSDDNFLLTRYFPDGQTDTSFGMTQSGFTALNFDASRGSSYDQLRDMLLQPDGKIITVGTGHSDMGIARFDANGIVDPTFGAAGFYVSPTLFSSASGAAYYDLRLYVVTDQFDDFEVARFTTEPGSPIYGSFNLAAQYTTVSENVGVAKIGVTRPFDAAYGTVTVNYLVTAGSATAGQDFIPSSGVLTFFEGETYKEISVPIINDTVYEYDETIQVFLFNPTGGAELGSVVRGTLTIDDNDYVAPNTFSLGYGDYSATENQGTATIHVSRTNASGPATVQYVTSDDTAKAGEDYGFVQGTLSFAAGETYKDVAIPITDDNAIEGDEKFIFTIFNATGSTRLASSARSVNVNIIDFEPITCNNAGALDPTFDSDGKATYTPTGLDPSNGVTLQQPDGKLVVAGTAWNSAQGKNVTLVARFLESGAIDTTFGTGGSVTVPARTDNDHVSGLFWQSGKLLIAGTTAGQAVEGIQLIRLNSDGSLDTTFGTGGIAAYDLTHPFDEMQAFVMQSDGKVVAAGYVENGDDTDRVVLRFNANGSLDSSFGNGGQFYYDSSSYDGGVSAMVIDPVGKILISSYSDLMRLNTNGTLDTTFGEGGFLRSNLIDGDFDAMLFQPDGKLLLAKQDYVFDPEFAYVVSVLRLNSNFTPDTTFGDAGVATANFKTYVVPSQLALQADGRILVAGGSQDFSVARFYPDGALDIGFGADGIVLTDFSGSDAANSLIVRTDGKIVVGGVKSDGFALARYVGWQSIGAFRVGAPTYSVQENGGSISVPVLRVCGMDQAVSVHYATANGTAVAGTDFDARSGTLSWANRQFGPQIVTIPIKDDQVFRGSRTFTLDLSAPTGGAVLQSPSSTALTIQDDEAPGRLGLHFPFISVNEGDGTASIRIDRADGSGGPVSVTLTATSGTATAGSDYQFTSQVVNFANKETTKLVSIPIVDDSIFEDAESFSLALSNPQGGATLTNMLTAAEVQIVDNEVPQPGTLEFATTRLTRNEDDESATLVVRRTGGTAGAVQAAITIGSGTATNGLDFASDDPITVSFAAGQESVSIPIAIIDDLLVEKAESVTFVLSDPTGGATLGDKLSTTLTILDNDYVANNVLTWQNSRNPYDVNDDGFVSPIDALLIINEINVNGPRKLELPGVEKTPPPYFDVSGDGYVVALDVLLVINYINVHLHSQAAEGEATAARTAAVDAWFSNFGSHAVAPPLEEFFTKRR